MHPRIKKTFLNLKRTKKWYSAYLSFLYTVKFLEEQSDQGSSLFAKDFWLPKSKNFTVYYMHFETIRLKICPKMYLAIWIKNWI